MRRLWISAVIASVAACADPRLDVIFPIPDSFRADVSEIELSILDLRGAEPFTCDDVARQEVGDEVLENSTEQQFRIGPSARQEIEEIRRVEPKMFLARGFSADGTLLLIGCAEVAEIVEDTTITLDPEPIPVLSSIERLPLSASLADPALQVAQVEVVARDRRGELVVGLDVSWQVIGPGQEGASGFGTTDANGVVVFSPARPTRPGPFFLELTARWATPVTTSGLVLPAPVSTSLFPAEGVVVATLPGRVGPAGEPGVVALVRDQQGPLNGGRAQTITLYFDRSAGGFLSQSSNWITDFFSTRSGTDPLIDVAIGFLDQRDVRDRVILASGPRRIVAELSEDTSTLIERPWTPPAGTLGLLDAVHPFGSCAGGPPSFLAGFTDGAFGVYAEDGTLVANSDATFSTGQRYVSSGCVAANDGTLRRVVLLDTGFLPSPFIVEDLDPDVPGIIGGQWLAVPDTIVFSRPLPQQPPALMGAQIRLDQIVVTRASLNIEADDQGSFATTSYIDDNELPGVPFALDSGDLDGDGLLDKVALSPLGDSAMLWTVLGREHREENVAGGIVLPAAGAGQLFIFDFDGDGKDDILFVASTINNPNPNISLFRMVPSPIQ